MSDVGRPNLPASNDGQHNEHVTLDEALTLGSIALYTAIPSICCEPIRAVFPRLAPGWPAFQKFTHAGRIRRWLNGMDLHLQTLNTISRMTNLLFIESHLRRPSNVSFLISKFGETRSTKTATNLSVKL